MHASWKYIELFHTRLRDYHGATDVDPVIATALCIRLQLKNHASFNQALQENGDFDAPIRLHSFCFCVVAADSTTLVIDFQYQCTMSAFFLQSSSKIVSKWFSSFSISRCHPLL